MNAEQLSHLEKSIQNLNTEMRKLTAGDDFTNLLKIIHRPGWTTVAEALLVGGIVEAMTAKTQTLQQLKGTLMKGADLIGQK